MKLSILTLLIAVTAATARAAEKCADCAAMSKLEGELNGLNYFDQTQNEKGSADVVKALGYVDAYAKLAKGARKSNLAQFQAVVTLVAAAEIYDPESATVQSLAALIDENPTLKTTYDAALAKVGETCRRQALKISVEQQICFLASDKGKKHSQDQANMGCIKKPVFNPEDCLKSHASH